VRSERRRGSPRASGKAVWTWPPVVAVDAGAMQIELRGRAALSRAETVLQGTRHDTVRAEIGYGEKVSQRLCLKKLDGGSIGRPGAAVRGVRKDAECSSWREWFHAAALICGGERSWISAAESLSMTFIAPPHLGQRQRPSASSVEATCCPACGSWAEPSN
jgi:hypothetical protein